ncbi:unnamed protein product [Brassicogethes aeneus]|uniref:xanthine dehydrogenase n=1 Tax=Brassicogethes aeneus TaxID=1431903 RepID=A0A9P0B5D1_BRAAE|nr:unnamed protein product [Brassicogethes aeneus]
MCDINPGEVTDKLVFFVNGKKIEDEHIDPEWTLLYYLRNKLRLCGTKLGCGEGGCGACTVMVSKYDRAKRQEVHLPVNACLAPVMSMHGLAVTTIEGIGSTKTKLHPVQERIAKAHGSQCGFCTPGIVMSMYTLLRNLPKPTMKDMEVAFQGNLCRCTGYRPIIEGYKTFTEEWELQQQSHNMNGNGVLNGNKGNEITNGCAMGEKCCKLQDKGEEGNEEVLFKTSEFTPYDASQEPIFPPELKLSNQYDSQYLKINGPNLTWHRPTTLRDLLKLKQQHPHAKILVGNTEIGVEVKFKNCHYPIIIQSSQIQELVSLQETSSGIKIGSSTTLTDIEEYLKGQIKKQPAYKTRIFSAILEMLHWFASKQIRSVGALGSNIMNGSPISDLIPILMASKASLEIASQARGKRTVLLDDKFFTGYRQSVVIEDEILLSITIPFTEENQYFKAYKQARRREDDIAIVNLAVQVDFKLNTNIIENISFGIGGMAPTIVNAPLTESKLKNLTWDQNTLELAYTYLLQDLPLDPSAPGGMINYRKSLVLSLFFKAYLTILKHLSQSLSNIKINPRSLSGLEGFKGGELKSSQYFSIVPETQSKTDAVHRPVVHLSAYKQACGEAVYCDDIPYFEKELYLAFVLSTKAHARILSIDPSEALKISGVHGFVSADDLDEKRNIWAEFHDEKIFYSDKVTSQGQIIAAVVADNQTIAQKAAKKVKVIYEELQPVIISIEEAIARESFFDNPQTLKRGDVDRVLKECPHVIEGECRMGGQDHFYLETQAVIVVPQKEDDEIEIYASTQSTTELQQFTSHALNIPQNRIAVKVKRLGGGFGGKETKPTMLALPVAVAAKKYNRPVRCMLNRDEDLIMTGGRHPFKFMYKIGFDDDGKMLACDMRIYANAGYSRDRSIYVVERAITHFENAYNIPAIRVLGYTCKTNLPSNTAFRGFGGPQAMYAAESMMNEIAEYLKKDPAQITELNLYREGDFTYYNQQLNNCSLERCWRECIEASDYWKKKSEIEKFNREHKYKKRGISALPIKYGVGFSAPFLNQAGALILVYTDGTVLLSHGGIEMGQGLWTKMIQVASRALEVPIELIHTSTTATNTVPNATQTAASSSSDLNGPAVIQACEKIKERLRPYKEKHPEAGWHEWVNKAYFDRVSLSATGFYKTPDINYDWATGEGNLYNYFSYGAACSQVEIDVLTGDHQVLRTDIVMDLGKSLNPAIDIGQIEGAFMQGYGLYMLEEMVYRPNGETFTRGPGTYKLPGFADIPLEFNVSLLKGVSNSRAVYSSKAIGEPPLFSACSVLFAVKDAIKSARGESGISESFEIDAPLTSAKIRMLCLDDITLKMENQKPGSFVPWNVIA